MTSDSGLNKGWNSVARRLQEFSSHADGRHKVISINVFVDPDNMPIFWYAPTMQKIEPKLTNEQLLQMLTAMRIDE